MLTITGQQYRFCDGLSRRGFLTVGGLAMGGLTLPQLLRAEAQQGAGRSHKAIINIFFRWSAAPGHVGSQAKRAQGGARRVR